MVIKCIKFFEKYKFLKRILFKVMCLKLILNINDFLKKMKHNPK